MRWRRDDSAPQVAADEQIPEDQCSKSIPDLNQDRLELRIQIESLQDRRNRHLLIKYWPDGLRAYDFSNGCGDYNGIYFAMQS